MQNITEESGTTYDGMTEYDVAKIIFTLIL
jgi:hypothetical protein